MNHIDNPYKDLINNNNANQNNKNKDLGFNPFEVVDEPTQYSQVLNKPEINQAKITPQVQVNHTKTMQNPYKVFVNTIKNPFEVETELDEQQQIAVEENNQKFYEAQVQKQSLPRFFYVEKNITLAKLSISISFLLGSLIAIIFFILVDYKKILATSTWFNNGYYAIPGIIGIIALIALIIQAVSFATLKKYIYANKNNFDPKEVSTVTQNLYKKLLISFININWLCCTFYLIAGFYLLIMCIVVYFVSTNTIPSNMVHFGALTMGSNPLDKLYYFPKICYITIGTLTGLVLLWQIISQLINWSRINKVELEFSVPIMTPEEKIAVKKATNKRNLIFFLVLFVILGLIALIVYLVSKRKR